MNRSAVALIFLAASVALAQPGEIVPGPISP